MAKMIRDAQPKDEFFFGKYKLVYGGIKNEKNETLYLLTLYKNKIRETRVSVDISPV